MTLENALLSLLAQKKCGWIEFKRNDAEPDDVGQYFSALAGSAALLGNGVGWIVWGADDTTRIVVGNTDRATGRSAANLVRSVLPTSASPRSAPATRYLPFWA